MRYFLLKMSGAGNRFLLADNRWFQNPLPAKWKAHSFATEKSFKEFLALAKKPIIERRAFLSSLLLEKGNKKASNKSPSQPTTDGLVVLRPLGLKPFMKSYDRASSLSAKDSFHSYGYENTGAQTGFACDFYNKDGSKADMCGNAACCLSSYAAETGLPEGDFLLGAGRVSRVEGGGIALPQPVSPVRHAYHFKKQKNFLYFIDTGVPHAVIERHDKSKPEKQVPPLFNQSKPPASEKQRSPFPSSPFSQREGLDFDKQQELKALARYLRFQNPENKKEGMNVSFFQALVGPSAGPAKKQAVRLRAITFERGVEDFTLSCGTGALAVAFVYRWKSQRRDLKEVFIDFPGGGLKVLLTKPPKLFSFVKKGW